MYIVKKKICTAKASENTQGIYTVYHIQHKYYVTFYFL